MSCNHSRREDTPAGYRCLKCGREVRSRERSPVQHGTTDGYDKHRNSVKARYPKEEWGWPPCSPCASAQRASGKAKRSRPEVMSRSKVRSGARARALARLQRVHGEEYQRYYAQELSVLLDGGSEVRSVLEQTIESVLLPLGLSPEKLSKKCAAGEAAEFERAIMRKVLAVNRYLIDLECPGEKEEPRRAGE